MAGGSRRGRHSRPRASVADLVTPRIPAGVACLVAAAGVTGVSVSGNAPGSVSVPAPSLQVYRATGVAEVSRGTARSDISSVTDVQWSSGEDYSQLGELAQKQTDEINRRKAEEAARKAAEEAARKEAEQRATAASSSSASQQSAGSSSSTLSSTVPVGEMQQWAHDWLLSHGYGEADFSAVVYIIDHESGWNVHATNPSSGAYGLPQALPGSKMSSVGSDWRDNYQTQLLWFFNYCNGRYGSIQGAYNFWVTNHWY